MQLGAASLAAVTLSNAAASTPPNNRKASGEVPGHSGKLSTAADQNLVETRQGKVRGYRQGGIYVFKGIPYGAPTSGANRFAAPQPMRAWPGVRSCMSYGPTNPNSLGFIEPGDSKPNADEDAFLLYREHDHTSGSEDCLRLNVWTPGLSGTGKRPVMIYMHGGGFTGGSGHDLKCYDGAALAESQDVVVITHNHRLNAFGFLNLEEIGGERYRDSANAGLLDNVAVLEWVRDNISQFGGDPGRVMIFGQSGGGGKVSCLMAMPAAKGLFHAAAVESGSLLRVSEPDLSAELAVDFLKLLEVNQNNLSRLETASTAELLAAALHITGRRKNLAPGSPAGPSSKRPLPGWGPTRDGRTIPSQPFDPVAPSISTDVPMIIGTNEHEFVNGVDNPDVTGLIEGDLEQRIKEMVGNGARSIIAAYKEYYPGRSPFDIYAAIAANSTRRSAFRQAALKAALKHAPVYEYIYAWRTPVLSGHPGTFHSAEITMVFNNAAYCENYTGGGPEALSLAARMSGCWAALARTGKPQHTDIQEWPAYDDWGKRTMIFNAECTVVSDPEGKGLRAIENATQLG